MKSQPTLETTRLTLRPFCLADTAAVQILAGAREIAAVTLNVPHPYEEGMAAQWISGHRAKWEQGKAIVFAMVIRETGALIGSMSLEINANFRRAELGYWVGVPFWGQGYATEAARALIGFGFNELGLQRIYAIHFAQNPASGRVMEKIGMQQEGYLRQHVCKWGQFYDVVMRGVLASD